MTLLLTYVAIVGVCLAASLFFALRRKRRAAIVILVAAPLLSIAWYQATRIDSVMSWLYPDDTVYSSGFSRVAFRELSTGIDQSTVHRLLGEPLQRRVDAGRECWHYSRHGSQFENYWNFIVIFDTSTERVVEKFREFYVD